MAETQKEATGAALKTQTGKEWLQNRHGTGDPTPWPPPFPTPRELRMEPLKSNTSLKKYSGVGKTKRTEHHALVSRREGTAVPPSPAAGAGASCPGSKGQGQALLAKVRLAWEGRKEVTHLTLRPGASPVPPAPRSRSFPLLVSIPLARRGRRTPGAGGAASWGSRPCRMPDPFLPVTKSGANTRH